MNTGTLDNIKETIIGRPNLFLVQQVADDKVTNNRLILKDI